LPSIVLLECDVLSPSELRSCLPLASYKKKVVSFPF
jgi:hypothetical protein